MNKIIIYQDDNKITWISVRFADAIKIIDPATPITREEYETFKFYGQSNIIQRSSGEFGRSANVMTN